MNSCVGSDGSASLLITRSTMTCAISGTGRRTLVMAGCIRVDKNTLSMPITDTFCGTAKPASRKPAIRPNAIRSLTPTTPVGRSGSLASSLVLRFDLAQALPFLVCAAVFASALIVWPPAALFQRRGRRAAGFARWLATITVLLDLLFSAAVVALIVLTSQQQPGLLRFGLPPEAAPLFWVPWLAAVLTVGVLWLAFLAWKDGFWSLAGRVHFTLVAVGAAGFIWLLVNWGLLGLN